MGARGLGSAKKVYERDSTNENGQTVGVGRIGLSGDKEEEVKEEEEEEEEVEGAEEGDEETAGWGEMHALSTWHNPTLCMSGWIPLPSANCLAVDSRILAVGGDTNGAGGCIWTYTY